MKRATPISVIRTEVANLIRAEGCHCCRDIEKYDAAKQQLAKLLHVPRYKDGSGYDFYRFAADAAKSRRISKQEFVQGFTTEATEYLASLPEVVRECRIAAFERAVTRAVDKAQAKPARKGEK